MQLYNGTSCAEIPARPNGFCNGDQGRCVVPFTPGNLNSACPNSPGIHFPRRVAKKNKRKGHKKPRKNRGRRTGWLVGPSTPGNLTSAYPISPGTHFPRRVARWNRRKGHKKQRKNRGRRRGRLVGPSTLHTHTRIQTMRYPWICSLKAQGFRWSKKTSKKTYLVYSGVVTSVRWRFSLHLQKKPFWWQRHIATTSAKVGPAFLNLAVAENLTSLALVLRWTC